MKICRKVKHLLNVWLWRKSIYLWYKSYYLHIYWQRKTIDRKHSNFSISLFSYFLRKSLIWIRRIWEKLYNNVYTYFLSKTYQFLLQTKNKTPIEYLQCFQKVFTRMLENVRVIRYQKGYHDISHLNKSNIEKLCIFLDSFSTTMYNFCWSTIN